MTQKKYVRQSGKMTMAQNVFLSWCRAMKIPATMQADSVFEVTTAAGAPFHITVLPTSDARLGTLNLPVEKLGSFDRALSRSTFEIFMKTVGYVGKKLPDRGANIGDGRGDFFLMSLRYSEFRDAPDPPKALVDMLTPTMQQEIRRFHRKVEWLCQSAGIDIDDLQTFGGLWIATFVHRYWIQVGTHEDGSDNQRLFRAFVRQRLSHLRIHLQRQFRASNLDNLTAKVHLYANGDRVDPQEFIEPETRDLDSPMPDVRLVDAITDSNRDRVLNRLRTIIAENIYEPSIKRQARKLLMEEEKGLTKDRVQPRPALPSINVRGISSLCLVCGATPGMHKCCKRCKVTANGESEIGSIFGFRTAKVAGAAVKIPQPWCRKCRSKHVAKEPSPVVFDMNKDVGVTNLRSGAEQV